MTTRQNYLYNAALDIVVDNVDDVIANVEQYIDAYQAEKGITRAQAEQYIHSATSEVLSDNLGCRISKEQSTAYCVALRFNSGSVKYISLAAIHDLIRKTQDKASSRKKAASKINEAAAAPASTTEAEVAPA